MQEYVVLFLRFRSFNYLNFKKSLYKFFTNSIPMNLSFQPLSVILKTKTLSSDIVLWKGRF